MIYKKWSSAEEEILAEKYNGKLESVLSLLPGRSAKQIKSKIERMGLSKGKYFKWSNSKILGVIEKRLEGKTHKEIAFDLGISEMAVRLIVHRKIAKKGGKK
jgi:hypothetical protein